MADAPCGFPVPLASSGFDSRGEREMGNSVRSSPAPAERPAPSPDGKFGFFGEDRAVGAPMAVETWQWAHGTSF